MQFVQRFKLTQLELDTQYTLTASVRGGLIGRVVATFTPVPWGAGPVREGIRMDVTGTNIEKLPVGETDELTISIGVVP
jgi:hypothetical protein